MTERVMASIEVVEEVAPIAGADKLEHYRVKGWWVVDRKGAYKVGDHVVFCEIDSFIPESLAPFLTKGKPKNFNGVLGNVLKTVKLRGARSQGLLLPLEKLTAFSYEQWFDVEPFVGSNVGTLLGIVKYERPEERESVNLDTAGAWPHFIAKTDQDRVQNIHGKWKNSASPYKVWEVTEKLEGQSFTAYIKDNEVGVCSRNVRLKTDSVNNWANMFNKFQMSTLLPLIAEECGFDFAIQGELCGPGIQNNIYGLQEQKLFIYNILNLTTFKALTPKQRWDFHNKYIPEGIAHAPVIFNRGLMIHNTCTTEAAPLSLEDFLEFADGKSALADVQREGVVFKAFDGESFKAISNVYLESGGCHGKS
jgi:RNA ligase (TIGR02306 family)